MNHHFNFIGSWNKPTCMSNDKWKWKV